MTADQVTEVEAVALDCRSPRYQHLLGTAQTSLTGGASCVSHRICMMKVRKLAQNGNKSLPEGGLIG